MDGCALKKKKKMMMMMTAFTHCIECPPAYRAATNKPRYLGVLKKYIYTHTWYW